MTEMIVRNAMHRADQVATVTDMLRALDFQLAEPLPHSTEDSRFRELLGRAAWSTLPDVVRRRFSRHLAPGAMRLYRGRVVETRLSRAGRLLAWVARLAGGPLPESDGATGAATVLVTEAPELGGQVWTRTYARPGRFPQTINSVKRFCGPTGLEEYLGHGLIMRLTLHAEAGCLVFRSAGYDVALGTRRFRIPRWLSPGACTITHRDLGGGVFAFSLELVHPRLGRLVEQVAHFEEV
ncbi:MAG: DUF4166 domain-containing protein [Hyphomicrobiaceae bacterium]